MRIKARDVKVGDTIPIRITNTKLRELRGLVTEVTPATISYIYTADSPVFGGLRGIIRRSTPKGTGTP